MTKKSASTSDGRPSNVFSRQSDVANSDAVRSDLFAIVDALDLPVVVVGRDFRVACFNRTATAVLGLTTSHIGQSPRDIGMLADVIDLEKLCAQGLADSVPCRREIRCGERWFLLRAPYPGGDDRSGGTVLTFTNVTAFRGSVDQAIHEREFTKAILNTVIDPLVVLDADLRIQTVSKIVAGSMIAGAALLASACTSNESSTNVTNTTEVVPTENVTTTDTMVTNIDAAAPMDNMGAEVNTTVTENTTTNAM